jgi:hypothetical protein
LSFFSALIGRDHNLFQTRLKFSLFNQHQLPPPQQVKLKKLKDSNDSDSGKETDTVTRWVVCSAFRKEQERLKIPTDPSQWERIHVAHWIEWAGREFSRYAPPPAPGMVGAFRAGLPDFCWCNIPNDRKIYLLAIR